MKAWTDEEREAVLEKLRLATAEYEAAERRKRERLSVKWKPGATGVQLLQGEAGPAGERVSGPAPERTVEKTTDRPRGFSIPGTRMPVKH